MRRVLSSVACVLLLTAPGRAMPEAGDTRFDYKLVEGSQAPVESVIIGSGRMRTDTRAASLMVDPAGKVLINLDHERKTFTRVTGTDFEAIFKGLEEAVAELKKLIDEFTPEERARMAELGINVTSLLDGPGPKLERVGETTIAGHQCVRHQAFVEKDLVSETCVVSMDQLKIPAADAAILKAALSLSAESIARIEKAMPQLFANMNTSTLQATGLALRQATIRDGVRHTSEVVRISHDTLPADAFAIPDGYKEQKFGGG